MLLPSQFARLCCTLSFSFARSFWVLHVQSSGIFFQSKLARSSSKRLLLCFMFLLRCGFVYLLCRLVLFLSGSADRAFFPSIMMMMMMMKMNNYSSFFFFHFRLLCVCVHVSAHARLSLCLSLCIYVCICVSLYVVFFAPPLCLCVSLSVSVCVSL